VLFFGGGVMIRKLLVGALISVVVVILPTLGRPEAMFAPKLWLLVVLGALAGMLQPAFNPFEKSATPEDRGTALQIVWSILLVQLVAVVEAVYFRYPESLEWVWTDIVALGLMLLGLGLRTWGVITLGRYFTWHVTVQPDQKVIRDGPYRFLRHPGYAGGLLSYFFTPLLLHAWFAAIFAAIVLPLAFLRRIRYEEALMKAHFGKEYEEYQREVEALFPLPRFR
jgi:protein-S-isoprenylcysteine O-methyltransferase Ste14